MMMPMGAGGAGGMGCGNMNMMGGGMGGGMHPAMNEMAMQQQAMMQSQMGMMGMNSMGCMPMMMVSVNPQMQAQMEQMNQLMMSDPQSAMKQMQEMMGQPGPPEPPPAPPAPPALKAEPGSKYAKYEKLVRRKQKHNANVVFIGGLRKTTEEDRVCAHFAKFGQVEHVDIKRQPDGTSRGFAFIKFADVEAVDKVIEAHAKHMIDNKWVEVKRHDGMAACAGMASSLQKKVEEEAPSTTQKEEEPQDPEALGEKWSEQYLAMSARLAEQMNSQQTDNTVTKETNKMGGGIDLKQWMSMCGMDPSMMAKMLGVDEKEMNQMMELEIPEMGVKLGMDPDKISNLMSDPSMLMMGGTMLMNPMMLCMDPATTMNMFGIHPMKLMGMDQGQMNKMMGGMGMMDRGMGNMMGGMGGMGMGCGGAIADDPMMAIADRPRNKAEHRESDRKRDQDADFDPKENDESWPRPKERYRSPSRSPDRQMPATWDPGRGEQSRGADGPPGPPGSEGDAHFAKTTLAGMLAQGDDRGAVNGNAKPEDGVDRKKAIGSIAAGFLSKAAKAAETSREAAKDFATAKAAAPPPPAPGEGGWTPRPRRMPEEPAGGLYLPEPTVREVHHEPAHHEPAQPAQPPRQRSRSPSRRKRPSPRRRSPSRRRRRGGGWDTEEPAGAGAPPQQQAAAGGGCGGAGGFSTGPVAAPSRPAVPPGQMPSSRPPGMHVPHNRFGVPEATPEALAAAVFRAQQVEAAGLQRIRETGQIPRGPPDLPTGTEVIEQKCVAYLIGRGGQALSAINAAAGVSIQIDQSTKTFGWSMANIYGSEEGAAKVKMILRQKVSEYRPLRA